MMTYKLSINHFVLIAVLFFFGCGQSVKEENKNKATASSLSLHAGDEKYMPIDTKQSVVTWKGASLMGSNSHTGYVYVSKGELMVENGQLMGGTVEVDMNTIEDEGHGKDNNLVKHLKDPDFFDVKKFPFSTIAITKVAKANGNGIDVTGNLTIKGITHPVTFPVQIEVKDGVLNANGKLTIDRAKWDVRYKSKKFYDVLANQAISDSIQFQVKMVAKR